MPSSLWILRLSACINSAPPKPPLGLRKPIQHFLFVTSYFSLLYFLYVLGQYLFLLFIPWIFPSPPSGIILFCPASLHGVV